jgi:hypothetical protein
MRLTKTTAKLRAMVWNTIIPVLTTLVVAAIITILGARNLVYKEMYPKEGSEEEDSKVGLLRDVRLLKAADFTESIKLSFEAVKHMSTITAGSFVVIATFLRDIFPHALSPMLKLLTAATFVCFGLALISSAWALWGLSVMPRTYQTINVKKKQQQQFLRVPAYFLITGLGCFGVAVLIDILQLSSVANICLVILLVYSAAGLAVAYYVNYQKIVKKERDREYEIVER